MIKKYEIIMDGSKKRIKALRSFHVQGRYVNIGDVGGIVYDENTLSQEGNGWIFSGNLNYPSIRVSGDSIVDTNGYEADVADPRPFVSITGTSALIGAHDFVTGALAARELAVADVEQGSISGVPGTTYEEGKADHAKVIRLKSLIYTGKATGNITASGAGYEVRAMRYDSNKRLVGSSSWGTTAEILGADYVAILIRKTPEAAIVPADITAAKVALPALSLEAYLDINDSRLEFQYTSAMTVATKVNPGNATSGVLKSVIDTSNVIISKTGNGAFAANIFADVVKCNVEWRLISARGTLIGSFTKVDRLLLDGTIEYASTNSVKSLTTVRDCRTFALSAGAFPINTANDAIMARMPFVFTRCNVPSGIFYHNANVKNIYTDIDFAEALTDLSKPLADADLILVSGERNGMYRVASKSTRALGPLVEAYDSVAGLTSMGANSYNTTIYKDAYFRGKFDFAGNNVFGNKVPGHPRAVELKAKTRVVQGKPDAFEIGSIVTGIAPSRVRVVTPIRYRINSKNGISVKNMPAGIKANLVVVNEHNVIEGASGYATADTDFTTYAAYAYAFVIFSKTGDAAITPDELGDTTITVYNGCRIVNTGATAVNMKGSIRVEDNATLVNASVVGTGYFGGNSVTENANVQGCMYIKDNAIFAPVAEAGKSDSQIHLEGNARFLAAARTDVNVIKMSGNSVFSGIKASSTIVIDLRDNAEIQSRVSGSGTLVMKDDARVEAGTLSATGEITLCGRYKQTTSRSGFFGKRTITDVNAPDYDDNVKTEYDF
ncbi:hypothetical protein BC679P1_00019 [Bacteroides phage BC679P1]|nr:hypothetical protein BC679P1_00019 [Bacteroides phage BC679P1]